MRSINTRFQSITPRKEGTSFEKYLQDIRNCGSESLTPEEEVELFKKVKEGDEQAKDKFIRANLRFVVSVAKQYKSSGIPLQDLIGEGNIGLMKAVERFDETRGFKFISYAVWWIRQSILQYISNQNGTIRRPLSQENLRKKIQNFENKFIQEYGFPPSEEKIKEALCLKDKEFSNYKETSSFLGVKSLDDTGYTEDSPLLDVVPDKSIKNPDFDLEVNSHKEQIMKILKQNLKPGELEIITSYYGLGGKKEKTLEEIGFDMELSRERVRQIRDRVLVRLSKVLNGTEIQRLYKSSNE